MAEKDLSVNQRIKFLIEEYSKLTQRAFAERIGVSQSAVSALFSQRENRPGLEMLQKIAVAFPEVSLEWLLLGQGNTMKPVAPTSEATRLESLVKKVLDEQGNSATKDGDNLARTLSVLSEPDLLLLLNREDELRRQLAHLKWVESGDAYLLFGWEELTPEKLRDIAAQRVQLHAEYLSTVYSRMVIERATLRQDAATNVYRVTGEADQSKTYGGLLSERLNIEAETALELVKQGHIRSVLIDGEGYRVSEQAVREFLGEA